jgi:two-component system cell cycle sensor histidine kinase/response regulator CckA
VSAAKKKTRRRPARVPLALLAAALRVQSEGVFIAERRTGRGLVIVFVNDSFGAMTGYAPEELIGRSHDVLHADRADVKRLGSWMKLARAGQTLAGEGFLVHRDGRSLSAAWSFDPLFNARGRLTHVVATYRDQTEKRRLHEALVHAQRLDAVGRLAGGVAHDFNNLISVINGYSEILAAHVAANPQALREVAEIHNAGRKAAALTQQLLAFSRRQPLNARVINLNTLVRDNAVILRRLVGQSGEVELELAGDLANVRTDPAQFQQVVFNLVLNARDALQENGRIVVTTANREIRPGKNRRTTDTPPGHYVALTVVDNGTGMDAETQKHLFEPFFTTKPEGKGTGLGLALVYGVVQQSGGYIAVRSALLVGSTFEILLPAVQDPVDEPMPAVAPLPSLRGSEIVLLIEEDEVVRKMVEGILTADGYRVTAGKSFDEVAAEKGMNGVQLLIANLAGEGEKHARRLREAQPALRVLCTSQNDFKMPVGWLAAERQACLNKPYALSELVRAARKLLDA